MLILAGLIIILVIICAAGYYAFKMSASIKAVETETEKDEDSIKEAIAKGKRTAEVVRDEVGRGEDEMFRRNQETRRKIRDAKKSLDTAFDKSVDDRIAYDTEFTNEVEAVEDKLNRKRSAMQSQIAENTTAIFNKITDKFGLYGSIHDVYEDMGYTHQSDRYAADDFIALRTRHTEGNEEENTEGEGDVEGEDDGKGNTEGSGSGEKHMSEIGWTSIKNLHNEVNIFTNLLDDKDKSIDENKLRLDGIETKANAFRTTFSTKMAEIETDISANKAFITSEIDEHSKHMTGLRATLEDQWESRKTNRQSEFINELEVKMSMQFSDLEKARSKMAGIMKTEIDDTVQTDYENLYGRKDDVDKSIELAVSNFTDTQLPEFTSTMEGKISNADEAILESKSDMEINTGSIERIRTKLNSDYVVRRSMITALNNQNTDNKINTYIDEKLRDREITGFNFTNAAGVSIRGLLSIQENMDNEKQALMSLTSLKQNRIEMCNQALGIGSTGFTATDEGMNIDGSAPLTFTGHVTNNGAPIDLTGRTGFVSRLDKLDADQLDIVPRQKLLDDMNTYAKIDHNHSDKNWGLRDQQFLDIQMDIANISSVQVDGQYVNVGAENIADGTIPFDKINWDKVELSDAFMNEITPSAEDINNVTDLEITMTANKYNGNIPSSVFTFDAGSIPLSATSVDTSIYSVPAEKITGLLSVNINQISGSGFIDSSQLAPQTIRNLDVTTLTGTIPITNVINNVVSVGTVDGVLSASTNITFNNQPILYRKGNNKSCFKNGDNNNVEVCVNANGDTLCNDTMTKCFSILKDDTYLTFTPIHGENITQHKFKLNDTSCSVIESSTSVSTSQGTETCLSSGFKSRTDTETTTYTATVKKGPQASINPHCINAIKGKFSISIDNIPQDLSIDDNNTVTFSTSTSVVLSDEDAGICCYEPKNESEKGSVLLTNVKCGDEADVELSISQSLNDALKNCIEINDPKILNFRPTLPDNYSYNTQTVSHNENDKFYVNVKNNTRCDTCQIDTSFSCNNINKVVKTDTIDSTNITAACTIPTGFSAESGGNYVKTTILKDANLNDVICCTLSSEEGYFNSTGNPHSCATGSSYKSDAQTNTNPRYKKLTLNPNLSGLSEDVDKLAACSSVPNTIQNSAIIRNSVMYAKLPGDCTEDTTNIAVTPTEDTTTTTYTHSFVRWKPNVSIEFKDANGDNIKHPNNRDNLTCTYYDEIATKVKDNSDKITTISAGSRNAENIMTALKMKYAMTQNIYFHLYDQADNIYDIQIWIETTDSDGTSNKNGNKFLLRSAESSSFFKNSNSSFNTTNRVDFKILIDSPTHEISVEHEHIPDAYLWYLNDNNDLVSHNNQKPEKIPVLYNDDD